MISMQQSTTEMESCKYLINFLHDFTEPPLYYHDNSVPHLKVSNVVSVDFFSAKEPTFNQGE